MKSGGNTHHEKIAENSPYASEALEKLKMTKQ